MGSDPSINTLDHSHWKKRRITKRHFRKAIFYHLLFFYIFSMLWIFKKQYFLENQDWNFYMQFIKNWFDFQKVLSCKLFSVKLVVDLIVVGTKRNLSQDSNFCKFEIEDFKGYFEVRRVSPLEGFLRQFVICTESY